LKIEEFVREVRAEASKRSYIRRVEIVEEGLSTAKILLVVRPEVKIQTLPQREDQHHKSRADSP